MRFTNVCLEAIGAEIPSEVWSSDDIEQRLEPLYHRLKLPEGRLQLMTGIEQRRVWPANTLPSEPSTRTAAAALEVADFDRRQVGCFIHASVCRDFLEPATASRVHHQVGLPKDCWVYDLSNACLGILNGAVQIATLIESGVIEAGIVVGTESSRALLAQTMQTLNCDESLNRKTVKPAFASLTIGSGSCAWLLTHRRISKGGSPFLAAVAVAHTEHNDLCRSAQDAGASMQPLMDTDSERLMTEGIVAGTNGFANLIDETGWSRDSIDRTVCHQVGSRHRISMLETLGLTPERDSVTFPQLGNTGSVALPLTLAAAGSRGEVCRGNRVALLGIGSGINSVMMAMRWEKTAVSGNLDQLRQAPQPVGGPSVTATHRVDDGDQATGNGQPISGTASRKVAKDA